MADEPPVDVSRDVTTPPERTWAVLTEEMGVWWPLGDFSASGSTDAAVAFRDGVLVETAPDGTEHVWGEVLDWEPPQRVRLTWHPGGPAGPDVTEVEFLVAGADGGSRVEIVHRGWERLDDPAAGRAAYEQGWPVVLAPLAQLLDESSTG
jgi:uncharacterized protein YndB with AHSA1/START domain